MPFLHTVITVLGGTAYKGGTETTEAKEGTLIDIVADAPASGKVFDKWEVVSGGVTLADATESVTLFAMPTEAVVIQATYKDSSTPVTDITAANVTVAVPVKGGTPANAATADTQYNIANTSWEPVPGTSYAPNTVYSVVIKLGAKDGYQFTDDTVFKINGAVATIVTQSAEEAKISFTFPVAAAADSDKPGRLPSRDTVTIVIASKDYTASDGEVNPDTGAPVAASLSTISVLVFASAVAVLKMRKR